MRNWMKVCGLAMALIVTCAAQGQTTFEVATIKPAAPLDPVKMAAAMKAGEAPKIGPRVEGSHAEYTYMTLRELISLAYNVKPYVGDAIRSALAQTFTDFELIVVDDGSTDGTAQVVRALAMTDLRIKLVQQANRGRPRADGERRQRQSCRRINPQLRRRGVRPARARLGRGLRASKRAGSRSRKGGKQERST